MQFTQSVKKDRIVPYFSEVAATFSQKITALTTPLLLVLFACILVACAGLFPASAWASDYTISKTVINSSVTKEGDLTVTESRTITLSGKTDVLSWCFENAPSGSLLSIKGVSVIEGEGVYAGDSSFKGTSFEGKGGTLALDNATALPSTTFNPEWKEGLTLLGYPETLSYSFDSSSNTVYLFTGSAEGAFTYTVEYVLKNGAQVYQDVTDMYWKYITADWKSASAEVFIQMTLPVPENAVIEEGSTIRAWSHGSPDAEIAVDTETGTVLFYTPEIKEGNYAELRVVFPSEWISYSNATGGNIHVNTTQINSILAQERSWKDNDTYWAQRSYSTVFNSALVVILMVVLGLLSARKFARENEVTLSDSYWYQTPEKGLPAAVVSRLLNGGKPCEKDFVVSVMELVEKGVISVEGTGTNRAETVFRLVGKGEACFENDLERRTANLLFEEIGCGSREVSLAQIDDYVKENGTKVFEQWNNALTLRLENEGFIEKYRTLRYPRLIALGLLGIVALVLCYFLTKVLALIPGVIAFGVVVFALYPLERISVRGAEILARLEGLKCWFAHLEKLNRSAVVTEEKSWPELFKYAYLLEMDVQVVTSLSNIGIDELSQSTLIDEERVCKSLESLLQ
ncbi:MAG: DUF2207 family protein [Anaerotardibacter sp.]